MFKKILEMASQGKGAKQKGTRYELKIAKILSDWYGAGFHRTPCSGGLAWGSSRGVAGDIVCDDPSWQFITELKCQERWSLHGLFCNRDRWLKKYIDQCVADCDKTKAETGRYYEPLIVFSRNNVPDYIAYRRSLYYLLKLECPVILLKDWAIINLTDFIQIPPIKIKEMFNAIDPNSVTTNPC